MTGTGFERPTGAPDGAPRRAAGRNAALAALRQATWEATQFLDYAEVSEYVAAVLREVESDEP